MCYIDPPFFSNKNYEIIWGNGYERRSSEDRWRGEILTYIEWMEKRVKLIHLFERIIKCSTNEGDIVLDCFGGGGTTAAVAAKLNRKFIVGDVSPVAVRVISDRLSKITDTPEFDLLNVPRTKTEWLEMGGHTFAEKICGFMGWECNPKKSDDGGIDGWANKGA